MKIGSVDKVCLNLEKFVLEESKKIAKEKSENSDDMRMLRVITADSDAFRPGIPN
jgi:hypothetical protein